MRKLIIAPIALLFVAALAPALGAPLFNGGTPVYAHPGHTACAGGAAFVFGLGSDPALGRGFGGLTAAIATGETLSDGITPGPGLPAPNALSNDVEFLHLLPGFLCDPVVP